MAPPAPTTNVTPAIAYTVPLFSEAQLVSRSQTEDSTGMAMGLARFGTGGGAAEAPDMVGKAV